MTFERELTLAHSNRNRLWQKKTVFLKKKCFLNNKVSCDAHHSLRPGRLWWKQRGLAPSLPRWLWLLSHPMMMMQLSDHTSLISRSSQEHGEAQRPTNGPRNSRYWSSTLPPQPLLSSLSGSFIFVWNWLSKSLPRFCSNYLMLVWWGTAGVPGKLHISLPTPGWFMAVHYASVRRSALNNPRVNWNKVDAALCLELNTVFIWQCWIGGCCRERRKALIIFWDVSPRWFANTWGVFSGTPDPDGRMLRRFQWENVRLAVSLERSLLCEG